MEGTGGASMRNLFIRYFLSGGGDNMIFYYIGRLGVVMVKTV